MFINPVKKQDANFNRPIYGIMGRFTLSQGVTLPYFTCNLEIDRAINELKIADQVPANLDNKWSLNELFQREIDEKRVENEIINGYLRDPRKIKFFNAITIVLMPQKSEGGLLDKFDELEGIEPPHIPWDNTDEQDIAWANHPEAKIINFGGVQLVEIGNSARLRWDGTRVLAVAVDGQHRLWSLRKFREDYRGATLQQFELETSIPVIFVLLDDDAGYKNQQDHTDYTIRAIARELFTDLNKNAKKVDKARELILDDRSVTALCVRTLITETTAQDAKDRLPLSFIRWQDDQNRFDSSYFLNSLVHLELVVKEMLNFKEPNDPMDKKSVEDFINKINSTLGIDGEISSEGEGLLTHYRKNYFDEDENPYVPFIRLPQQYLDPAVAGFEKKFRPWIVKLLLNFKPYKELLDYARANNLITGTFGQYVSQSRRHKELIVSEKGDEWRKTEIDNPIVKIQDSKENQWAYKAIFQKAILRLGKKIEFENNGTDRILGTVDDLITFLDRLYDTEILKLDAKISEQVSLWAHIALNASNLKIKVARTVEDRIYSLLMLWYYGSRKLTVDTTTGRATESPRHLLNFFAAKSNTDYYPGCSEAYEILRKGFNNPSFFGRGSEKLKDKQKESLIKKHFTEVFATGLPDYEWKTVSDESDESDDIAETTSIKSSE